MTTELEERGKKFVAVQYQDDNGHWRVKLRQKKEGIYETERQNILLHYLEQHGRVADACRAAGVSTHSVKRLRMHDSDFDEACMEALASYTDRVIAHHQDLVFNGTVKRSYDRNGQLISEERQYPVRLIELELKKIDDGYREKREVNMNVSGGVLIAPADTPTIDDWEARFADNDGKTIEGTASEIKKPLKED